MANSEGFGAKLKGLKDIFVTEEDGAQASPSPAQAVPAAPRMGTVTPLPVGTALPAFAQADPEARKSIEKELAGVRAPAYQKLRTMLASMAGKIPDEGTRLSAAGALLGAEGITGAMLVSEADRIIEKLGTIGDTFARKSAEKLQAAKAGGEQKRSELDARLAEVNRQIEALTQQATELDVQRDGVAGEISKAEGEHNALVSRMSATLSAVTAEHTATRERIKQHIGS